MSNRQHLKHLRGSHTPFELATMLMEDPSKFVQENGTALCGQFYPGGGPSLLPHILADSEVWYSNAPEHDVYQIDWSLEENWNPVTGEPYTIIHCLPQISTATPVKGQGKLWKYGWNRAADALGYIITEDENKMPLIQVLCVKVGGETAFPGGFIDRKDSEQILQNFPDLEDFVFAAAREFCEECFQKETLQANPHIYRCVLETMARDGIILGRNVPMTCDQRTTQNAGVCTSVVAFEIPSILLSYISAIGDGDETSATFWMDVVTPFMPGDLSKVVPMRANHNYFLAELSAEIEPRLHLPFCKEVWEYVKGLHLQLWVHASEKTRSEWKNA